MKYLVTGGAGYLGSVLVPLLLARGDHIIVLDRFPRGDASLASCCNFSSFEPVKGDVRDTALVSSLMRKADIIIPLAALVGAPACEADPWAASAINCDAIIEIVRNLGRGQQLIYPNTNSGYGIGGNAPCTENMPLNPISVYGRTKCTAERAVLDAGGTVLRLATVFGSSPRMRIDLLVNDFVHRAITDKAITLFESNHRRSIVHVNDVANAFIWATERAGVYNIVNENLTKNELCSKIAGHVPEFVFTEAAVGKDPDQRDYAVSGELAKLNGYSPEWTIDGGIRQLIKLYAMLNVRRFVNA